MGIKIVFLLCLLTLTLQMNSIECNLEGCQSCSAPNICQVCQENYQLTSQANGSSACLRTDCSENCAACNQDNQCLSCLDGFRLTQTGACASEQQVEISKLRFLQGGNLTNQTNCTIPGCQFCVATSCLVCRSGFQFTMSGSCMSCNVSNCRLCSSPDVCAFCFSDYNPNLVKPSPNGAQCHICDNSRPGLAGCISCNGTNSCGLCINGLQLFESMSGGICILCNISNCESCEPRFMNSSATVCTRCAVGYSVSPQGNMCTQCLFPCETCLAMPGPNNCAVCQFPLFFPEAKFDGTCVRNLIPGCMAPNTANSSLCGQCAPGFSLSNDSAKCNWNCPLNCLQCTSNVSCSFCVVGFYVNSSNLCSQCQTKGCQQCSADGITCNVCITGFYQLSGECKACPGFCLQCTSNTTCLELAQSNNQVLLMIGGQSVLAVCESTCITCSNTDPSRCLECTDGFFLDTGKCLKCGGNCRTCSSANRDQCLSCYPNTFLSSSNTCVRCNSNCMTCQNADNPAKCTSCWDGFYLEGQTCTKGCPKNCFTCSSLTNCTQCLSGYTTFRRGSDVICAPCMTSCRTCAEGRPSTCLSCGTGFYLLNVTCKPCAANCAECTAAGCLTCSPGFFMTSEQTCALNCILPCATCSPTAPDQCESCIAGYTFDNVNKECVEVTTCPGGCIVCPMGYSLKDGQCLACTKQNCQACDANALGTCYSCKPKFYLMDDGTCGSCPSQCRTCLSATGCSSCASGFTKKENAVPAPGGFECIACNAPCKTCMNTPDYCTSCVEGFDFFGWKCAQKFRFTFGLTLTVSLTMFESNYMLMIEAFAAALMVQDSNAITITSITSGSVVLAGNAAPTGAPGSAQASQQLASLTALVKSGNVAGMVVGESNIIVEDAPVPMANLPSEQKKTNVLAIVLGICIPIGVLIIIGIIVFVIYKKKAAQKVRDFDTEEERKNTGIFNNTNDKIVN